MDETTRSAIAARIHDALRTRTAIPPVTAEFPGMSIEDAYAIQRLGIALRLGDGARIVGMKIGLTSKPIQQALGVDRPDFGHLLSSMHVPDGGTADLGALIAPRAEGEIAFVLGRDLPAARCTEADVLAATEFVLPAIEIIDSRIADWKITLADTVADNASSGMFVLGGTKTRVDGLDLRTVGMNVELNGDLVATGAGAASLGSPVRAVAWLATTLSAYGMHLRAGDVILSGGLAAACPVRDGDWMRLDMLALGTVSVHFSGGGAA